MEITSLPSHVVPPAPSKATSSESKAVHKDTEQTPKQQTETYSPSKRPPVKEMSAEERESYIEELRQKSEKHFESLKNLVRKMLEKQGFTFQDVQDGKIDWDTFEVDDATRAEAAANIAEDGPFGVEATSNRIVNFAIALSGGDVEKLGILREAIDEGFKAVKDIFGELPEISLETQRVIHDKLDQWEKEQRGQVQPEPDKKIVS